MGTSGELITAVATALDVEALGLTRESVFVAMRELRAAEMIPVGGRGLSGATMTEREAAKLLIAVTGALQLKQSAEAVRTFSALPLAAAPGTGPGPRDLIKPSHFGGAPDLRPDLYGREPSAHFTREDPPTFGQVLELVLSRSRDRTLFFDVRAEDIDDRYRERHRPFASYPYLRVTLERPRPRASLAWGVMPYVFEELVFGDRAWETDSQLGYLPSYAQPPLVQERTFGLRAVEAVGLFLRYTAEREERSGRRRGA